MTECDGPKTGATSETVRLKHLDYVQSVVSRMAHASTQAKSWLLPVVTATFGYALTQRSGTVALLGIAAILLFGYMDASYLRQERAYRRLYNAVVSGEKVPELSLDPHDIDRNIQTRMPIHHCATKTIKSQDSGRICGQPSVAGSSLILESGSRGRSSPSTAGSSPLESRFFGTQPPTELDGPH